MKVKSWPKLIFSIILAQSAGLIGTIFTFNAIPTWYGLLNKPSFSPPNWVFGPIWTILYTLIGVSMYLVWTNKKGDLKLFLFHLFLNAIWSPIFFGTKNLGLAFIVILLMDLTLIIIIKNFYKINRSAAYLLVPYLLWIIFATLLNFSIWKLNPNQIYAQEFNFNKAREDYIFTEDVYKKDLFDLNLKRSSYQKNPTLSLKEEARLSLYKFVGTRNSLVKNYLTMLRVRVSESSGVVQQQKDYVYSKIDSEAEWFSSRKSSYSEVDRLEDILRKSKEEDVRYETGTLPVIYLTLAHISLGDVKNLKENHIKLYSNLKSESENLIKLGRADASLFDRWFKDIDQELTNISEIERLTLIEIEKIFGSNDYERARSYKKSIEKLSPSKQGLLRLNGYVMELENIIANKR